jgi:ABC-type bacteriocin/lantibiotic exporter with double-glycine peptidase domain
MLVIPGMIVPGMTAVFVDKVLIQRFDGWLGPLLVGLGVTFLLSVALHSLQGFALLRIELRLALEQSARFGWHVLSLPVAFFSQRYTGDLVNRVEANDRVATLLARDFGNAAASCLTAVFLGAVMISYDLTLSAIVLGSAALNIVVLRLLQRSLSDVALRLQMEQGRLFSTSVVGLQSIETLKATGGENDFFSKWAGYHARAINSEQKLAIHQQTIDLLPTVLEVINEELSVPQSRPQESSAPCQAGAHRRVHQKEHRHEHCRDRALCRRPEVRRSPAGRGRERPGRRVTRHAAGPGRGSCRKQGLRLHRR